MVHFMESINIKRGLTMDKFILALFGLSVLCFGCQRERAMDTKGDEEAQEERYEDQQKMNPSQRMDNNQRNTGSRGY